jgi:virginiamycin B lyase
MLRHRRTLLVVTGLILASMACALQGSATTSPSETEAVSIEPAAVTPTHLDLCTLLSAAEVSDALGQEVEVQPGLQTGACSFATSSGAQPKSVSVSAAQGSQARDLIQMAASLGLLFGGDAASMQIAEDLQANAASMSLTEVVDKANMLLAPLGYVYSPADVDGAQGTWGWNPLGAGSLQRVSGDTYLAVSVVGLEEPAAKALTESLLTLAAARLPAAFTIDLAESMQIQFTAEIPAATEPAPDTPEPPALSSIWVADRLAGRVARIDAATGNLVADIAVGTHPMSIAVGEGAVWVGNQSDGTVSRIDPETNQVVATIDVADQKYIRLAVGEGRVWVAACLDKAVKAIDPATNQVTASVPVEGCWNVAVGGGQVWVPTGERTVTRVDPASLTAMPTVFVQSGPAMIVPGFDSMWVGNVNAMTVSRFDPLAREVTATLMTGLDHVQHSLHGLATGEGRVWVATTAGILGFDPATNTVASTFTAVPDPWFLATAGGALWVTTDAQGGIFAVDPMTGDLVRQVAWGTAPFAIAAGP